MKQPKIRFFLETKKKVLSERIEKELIMASVNYGYFKVQKDGNKRYMPFKISTQKKIKPQHFGRIENNFSFDASVFKKSQRNNNTIKNELNRIENGVMKLYDDYERKQIFPDLATFKNDLEIYLNRKKDLKYIPSIEEFLIDKIENDTKNLNTNRKDKISPDTIKMYVSLLRHIENYQIATNSILTFNSFNQNVYENFWFILNEIFKGNIEVDNPNQKAKQRKNENGYASKSLRKHQKNFITMLRKAEKKGYKTQLDLNDTILIQADTTAQKEIYITESELSILINSDLSDEKLNNAREYAIIIALTGLRDQTMRNLKSYKIELCSDENYNFRYFQSYYQKSKTECITPILKPVFDIIKKHNGKFPVFPSNQKINENLKILYSHLGFNQKIKISKKTFSDGVIIQSVSKSDVISTHDGKRGFYTNLFNHKVNVDVIDGITHPDKAPKNAMAKFYNKSNMLDRAKHFVDEINKINSDVYHL